MIQLLGVLFEQFLSGRYNQLIGLNTSKELLFEAHHKLVITSLYG